MPLDQAGIKEHVFNILTEAGVDTVGTLMMKMKVDPNSVLGLPGIGPKAIQNIEESLAALTFPEAAPAEPTVEPVAEAEPQPEAVAEVSADAVVVPVEEMPVAEKQAPAKKDARKHVEEEEDEGHKDGVSLDDLFTMKPEIFQTAAPESEEDEAGKKKGKKGKKKSVELEFDEERGEVVSRKKHKRGGDDFGEEW
jgi:N utilization substance protein A